MFKVQTHEENEMPPIWSHIYPLIEIRDRVSPPAICFTKTRLHEIYTIRMLLLNVLH